MEAIKEQEQAGGKGQEEQAAAAPAAPAAPPQQPKKPLLTNGPGWEYDAQARVLRVGGIEFSLKIPHEELVKYSEMVRDASGVHVSLSAAISAFERGEWKDYTNAAARIKVLHGEQRRSERTLQSLAATFGSFFEPEGLMKQFAGNSQQLTAAVRTVIGQIAKG